MLTSTAMSSISARTPKASRSTKAHGSKKGSLLLRLFNRKLDQTKADIEGQIITEQAHKKTLNTS